MSIHLAGGGWSVPLFQNFVTETQSRAAGAARVIPRIGVLLLADDPAAGLDKSAQFSAMLTGIAACDPIITVITDGAEATSSLLSDIDGLLIGGGVTPDYLEAVIPIVEEIRLLVGDGLPYLGFSAGAAIAADESIVGGWKIGDVPVGSEEIGEGLEEVTVVAGLGLVDLAVDVHAAQWGTLARLIAATEAGLVAGGVAIDEDTVLIVGEGDLRVEGIGSVWRVTPHDDGILVSTLGA
ncbi:Type 1 glutamine amidotransferase-like domain-containing protein [Glaciihabitans sp. dw_435]|uniref:Type 1 glutamine amidotransferase-like domain-containing protein n=1 Tax=Glaciihabitans sp. dw_435 TaxID=2720081 RepID=UPI001BD2AE13|nr:Type 1 glutamine amidotransferase-like domain-containing protein [Glaciihabitans sp. dw_435]